MFYALCFSVDSNKKKHSHGSASGTATPRKTSAEFRMTSSGPHGEEISLCRPGEKVEYFFASDASAIIEHTNRYSVIYIAYFILLFHLLPRILSKLLSPCRVIFLEDDDVAAVSSGVLSIHRISRNLDQNNPISR